MSRNVTILPAEFDVLEPITKPDRLSVDGVVAFAFHNTGETDVKLNKFWTVKAGANFMMSIQMTNVAIFTLISVEFVGAGTRQLEVATLRLTGDEYSNL